MVCSAIIDVYNYLIHIGTLPENAKTEIANQCNVMHKKFGGPFTNMD